MPYTTDYYLEPKNALPRRTMPKTAFVKTDPLIIVVERMMKELRKHDSYQIVGYTEITSNGFHPPIRNAFRRWNDFTRTAGAVMRLYMLKATHMLEFHNPKFNNRKEHMDAWIYSIRLGPQDKPINMAAGNRKVAKHLSAEFDRQFPHYTLENVFEGMIPGDTRSYSSVMYVVDLENQEVYHIASSLTVTRLQDDHQGHMIIDAIPHLAVFKLRLQNLPEEPDQGTHPNTKMIKDLLAEYYSDENWVQDFQNLLLEDLEDDSDDDIETEVNGYFEQLQDS